MGYNRAHETQKKNPPLDWDLDLAGISGFVGMEFLADWRAYKNTPDLTIGYADTHTGSLGTMVSADILDRFNLRTQLW